MAETMVLLVGEQPLANLLPVRHLKPKHLVLVHTDRTRRQADRLVSVFAQDHVERVETSAYNMVEIRDKVGQLLSDRGWRTSETTLNLTGGTKAMAFAVYELAVRLGLGIVYLQSEGPKNLLYHYTTAGGAPHLAGEPADLVDLISLDDYIRAHVKHYKEQEYAKGDGGKFEQAVYEVIRDHVDEVKTNVRFDSTQEIDFLLRRGNTVAVVEAKMGGPKIDGLNQLAAVCSRENLGTYTRRALIAGSSWRNASGLVDLAAARSIKLIELHGYQTGQAFSEADCASLLAGIDELLK